MKDLAVLDTNIVIDWLNGHPAAVQIYSQYCQVVISRVTYAEVLVGYKDPEIKNTVAELLEASFLIDDTTVEIALEAVKARQATRVGLCDAFIYATAVERGCVVYSRNPKDFKKLKAHNDAAVEMPYEVTCDLRTLRTFEDMTVIISEMTI